jgi:two-component system cell cycle sensor histidine kinase/response regulator CckA
MGLVANLPDPPMSSPPVAMLPSGRGIARFAGRALPLAVLGLAVAAAAAVAAPGPLRLALVSAAATLVVTALLLRVAALILARRRRRLAARWRAFVAEDAAPCFTTDREGQVHDRNRAAEVRFGPAWPQTLGAALGDLFAHPAAVLYRLQSRAAAGGAAREDVVTRRGHVRLSVRRIDGEMFLWRLDEMLDRSGPGAARGAEGLSLPMLVASRTGTVLFTNEALRRLLGGRPRTLDRVFTDPAIRSGQTAVLCGPDGPLRALVAEIEGAGERREIYLLPGAAAPGDATAAPPGAAAGEDLPVALLHLTPQGRVRAANRRAREMLGLAEGAGPALPEILDGPGRPLRDWIADLAAGRLPPRPEVLRLRAAEDDRFVQFLPHRAADGSLAAVLTDATALKQLEAQFVQGQKMQAIGQLAGGIAHDFNNLLTAIAGHCDLLLLRRDATDPDWGDLMQIHHNANRAAALVAQLLAFSRKQMMRPERLDLADVIGDVAHLLRRLVGEKVTLDLALAEDPGAIRADRRQFEQVLVNLVVNARDAMPQGGPIRIATAARRLAAPMQRGRATVPAGDYAVVTVSDRGTGIAPELHEKIFEPFFTTKRAGEGTGLGLSTVYGIVKQTGGFVFLDSAPGAGSVFTLWFPVMRQAEAADPPADAAQHARPRPEPPPPDAAAPELAPSALTAATLPPPEPPPPEPPAPDLPPPQPPPPEAPGGGPRRAAGTVLLVEDEAPVRAFASRALRLRGHTVLEAASAEEALAMLDDPAVAVDVFVTDVMMPGLDGPTWVRRALERRPGVRVVFVSGYARDDLPEAERAIPDAVFLAKPFSLEDLARTVRGQLH